MEKINKKTILNKNKTFHELIQNTTDGASFEEILKNNVNEFKIGKNYFYEIIDNDKLIRLQNDLNIYLQKNIPINNAAVAFRKNFSYLNLFEPHRKNYHFLRLDIKSFFHSIRVNDIKDSLKEYFNEEYIDEKNTQTLLEAFIKIITYKIPTDSKNKAFRKKQVLPMGFITSPVISNIIFRKLDIQIQKFCSQRNIIYTRYADDMLFSTNKKMGYIHSDNFINEIRIVLSQMNFKLNKKKTIKCKHTISLNGYTIQYSIFNKGILGTEENITNEVRISNKKILILKKLFYMIEKKQKSSKEILEKLFNYKLPLDIPKEKQQEYNNHQLVNKLNGYRSYLLSVVIFDSKYECCQKNTISKYIRIIEKLNKLVEKYNKTSHRIA